ncbi:hypothetical protein AWH63_10465 [Marinobacter sp. C18]|uniref:DEAD/DEAH box helicase n=1 Tax=Marinobacter sp. C18 TaxID=1772288 RepID=UPI000948F220|nr:AAA domain-containing protein [Marinobacter sp. C18]OLF81954.1 hypothetical protein AWH63_10465 [Marinobacter sp. C18]
MSVGLENIVRYYSFCLTDAQAGRASITKAVWGRLPYRRLGNDALTENRLAGGSPNTKTQDDLLSLSRSDIDAWLDSADDWIPLVWHPLVFERSSAVRHGIQTHQWAPDFLAPVSILIYAHRDGRVVVVGRPRFSRECLEPAAQGAIVLGSVEEADRFYDSNPFVDRLPPTHEEADAERYANGHADEMTMAEAAEYAQALFEAVCQADPQQPIPGVQFHRRAYGVVLPARQGIGAIEPLLRTYDAIETLKPDLGCFKELVSPMIKASASSPEPIERRNLQLARWGTINSARTLSADQTNAIGAALLLQDGQNQAIHGPPGTGKTAILQEIVASHVVESVLRNREPPQIVIASTNNQALRNALHSFRLSAMDRPKNQLEALLSRRWIEQWPTLGFYNAASSAASQAQSEGLPVLEDMERLERTIDTQSLSMVFIQNVRSLTKSGAIASIADATDALRALLKAEAQEQLWAKSLPAKLRKAAKSGQIEKALASFNEHEKSWRRRGWLSTTDDLAVWNEIRRGLQAVRESQLRLRELKANLHEINEAVASKWKSDWSLRLLSPFRGKAGVRRWSQNRLRGISVKGESVDDPMAEQRKIKLEIKQHRQIINQQSTDLFGSNTAAAWSSVCERILHEKARSRWFWIALHVREGEWIECMNTTLRSGQSDGRTQDKMANLLKRRFMLTPVMVSTLHRLPKVLSYWDVQRQAEIPLFEQADLLIVDEAGQCAPDVAGASASLTKKMVAIGDRAQLEPIWSLELREDLGNRVASDLVPAKQLNGMESDRVTRSGGDTSSGSLLHLMQGSTHFDESDSEHSGLLLTQHRRCLPEIFEFCNQLAYKGRLSSVRESDSVSPLPAIGYIDCPGREVRKHGSRCNEFEALMMAHFLEEHEASLKAAYDKPLSEIVGIVAPFKAQAEAIEKALSNIFGRRHNITVGTVHSLQGAERPVILFSLTYNATPTARSYFFDQSTSMFNVAVSRAQDSFVVVGDLDTLNHSGLPGRSLGQHLRDQGARLPWPSMPEAADQKLAWQQALEQSIGDGAIYKETESDNALIKALSEKELGSVVVVSDALDRAGLQKIGNAMIKASRSGMKVSWLISHEYLLGHKDGTVFMKALETIRGNGVNIQYVGATFGNLIILPDAGIALWGESSWMLGEPPKRMATTQSHARSIWARIAELHNLGDQSESRLSA